MIAVPDRPASGKPAFGQPAFGQADLTNCEREPIHLAGSIQPNGALLVVREPDRVVVQASANAADFLGLAGSPLGRTLAALGGDLDRRIARHVADNLDAIPVAIRCTAGPHGSDFDILLHRPPAGGLIVEFEPVAEPVDLSRHVERALQVILSAHALRMLCDESARIFRELTGFDRVMVYRFDETGHGEVFSEQRRPGLEAFLGNRYPATDIPQIARRLYVRNRVRVLSDVEFRPVPLEPRQLPDGSDLDMSLCILRSSSPIHVQYLKNMGVRATLVVSLVIGDRLWGLIACHHYEPRFVHFEARAVCEVLSEAIATRIAALESFARGQAELAVRRLEQRMIEAIAREGDWRGALFDRSQALLQPMGATGAALLFDGQILTTGDVPGTTDLRAIGTWLDGERRRGATVVSTASLGRDVPAFEPLTPVASGLVAVGVSETRGEYLMWFRPERIQTVTWGGDPFKAVVVGNDPTQLSPRRSFAQWHQLVEGTSDPWTAADLTAARLIGDTLADVILQSRSVRMLIAHDQLEQLRREVGGSGLPVLVADATGVILLANDAFARLLPKPMRRPRHLDDLGPLFVTQAEARDRLQDLIQAHRTWRGEVQLGTGPDARPMLVRADAILSAPDHVLGFVLLFTDLAERKRAEAARRTFYEGILDGHRIAAGRLDRRADMLVQNVLASVVENAQLAALEITDSTDLASMAEILEGVRASVARAAEVFEHLVRHAASDDGAS
jgi:light-regulated signal transduction histidine kinase (bacteriophytochrome)